MVKLKDFVYFYGYSSTLTISGEKNFANARAVSKLAFIFTKFNHEKLSGFAFFHSVYSSINLSSNNSNFYSPHFGCFGSSSGSAGLTLRTPALAAFKGTPATAPTPLHQGLLLLRS